MWDVLEMAPTTDLKAIKRAYARQLKLTRPDEKRKEFMELNDAYKMALDYAERYALKNFSSKEKNDKRFESAEIELDSPYDLEVFPSNQEEDTFSYGVNNEFASNKFPYTSQVDEMALILKEVEDVLKDGIKRQKKESWFFLEEITTKCDFYFQWQLGQSVMILLYKHHQAALKEDKIVKLVRAPILLYLDEVFHWTHDEEQLRECIGDKVCDSILSTVYNYMLRKNINVENGTVRKLRGGSIIYDNEIAKKEKKDFLMDFKMQSRSFYIPCIVIYILIKVLINLLS